MGDRLTDLFDPEDILRTLGGKWAKYPCDKCGARTYTLPVSEYVIFCIGCQEEQDECSCDSDSEKDDA